MPLIHPADQEAAPVPGPRRPSPYPRGYDGAESATATAVLDDEEELAAEELAAAYPGARPDQGGTILGVGLTLLVADLDRSVAFYRDTLGFDEVDLGDGNAVLASGDTRLVLRTVQDVAPVNRRVMHINLEVGDVAAVYADLRERGVKFTYAPRVVNRGERLELWAAAFKDPDGHGVALTQWRRPEPPPERAPDQAPEPATEPLREPRGRIAERLNPDAPPAE
jgi:catechol 2,3-dioxygenase-like lactoylglutathione lyase family enzyme